MKISGKGIAVIGVAAVFALAAGAFSGAISADLLLSPRIDRLADLLSHATSTPQVPVTPPVVIVPLENRPILPSYPQAIADRRQSPTLPLVRHARTAPEDSLLAADKSLGAAVALTSDGWMLTTESALSQLKLADLGLVKENRVHIIKQGSRDLGTGLVFLKTDAMNLPSVSFVRASDVGAGIAVWVESAPGVLVPDVIADASYQPSTAVSSERIGRRFVLGNKTYPAGSSVWDSAGRLIGLVESSNQSLVIPTDSAADFLSGLLSTKGVSRASLGLKAIDLSNAVFDSTSSLPLAGAWIRAKGTAPGSKALQDGDVIERIERDILDGSADLGEHLLDYRPGADVTLSVWRKGTVIQVQAKLGSFSASEALK